MSSSCWGRLVFVAGIKQRLQRLHVFGAHRNVGALVTAEAFEYAAIVIPKRARMQLHNKAVVQAHRSHLGQHLSTKLFRFRRCCVPL